MSAPAPATCHHRHRLRSRPLKPRVELKEIQRAWLALLDPDPKDDEITMTERIPFRAVSTLSRVMPPLMTPVRLGLASDSAPSDCSHKQRPYSIAGVVQASVKLARLGPLAGTAMRLGACRRCIDQTAARVEAKAAPVSSARKLWLILRQRRWRRSFSKPTASPAIICRTPYRPLTQRRNYLRTLRSPSQTAPRRHHDSIRVQRSASR